MVQLTSSRREPTPEPPGQYLFLNHRTVSLLLSDWKSPWFPSSLFVKLLHTPQGPPHSLWLSEYISLTDCYVFLSYFSADTKCQGQL